MYGANRFINHEVSLSVLMAEAYMDEHGWSAAVTIPKCHRCVFEEALVGSAARSEAEALFAWHRELDLNFAAKRADCKRTTPTVCRAGTRPAGQYWHRI